VATHALPAADLFNQQVEGTAWKMKPSWYILAAKRLAPAADGPAIAAWNFEAATELTLTEKRVQPCDRNNMPAVIPRTADTYLHRHSK